MDVENKSISVWLVLKDGENRGKIILQKRSNKETSCPFICQATWAGKVEKGEDIESAIKRECKEELGTEFSESFNFSDLQLLCEDIYKNNGIDCAAFNYLGFIDADGLKNVRLHQEAQKKFIFVGLEDQVCSTEAKENPENCLVLFDDQYKVLKNILNASSRNK